MTEAALILPGGRELRLVQPVTIGRGPRSRVVLDDATVSREHAVVDVRDGRWCIADRGSFNGTFVNGSRVPPGVPHPLRHFDRIKVGAVPLVFAEPEQLGDPQGTAPIPVEPADDLSVLSPFQLQVVRCLCRPWMAGESLDTLPTNRDIAGELGTPNAEPAVKAALRRAYGKAGLTDLPAQAKRRQLCRIARQRGWL